LTLRPCPAAEDQQHTIATPNLSSERYGQSRIACKSTGRPGGTQRRHQKHPALSPGKRHGSEIDRAGTFVPGGHLPIRGRTDRFRVRKKPVDPRDATHRKRAAETTGNRFYCHPPGFWCQEPDLQAGCYASRAGNPDAKSQPQSRGDKSRGRASGRISRKRPGPYRVGRKSLYGRGSGSASCSQNAKAAAAGTGFQKGEN